MNKKALFYGLIYSITFIAIKLTVLLGGYSLNKFGYYFSNISCVLLIIPFYFIALKHIRDRDYKGVGQGDFAENIHIYDKVDEVQFQKDLKTVINVDTTGTSTTVPKSGYLITDGETKTYLTDERLEAIIDSDPTMEDWKREQLQTLERKLEAGDFDGKENPEAAMNAEYAKRLKDFRQNTIDKLGYEKVGTTHGVAADSTWNQKQNRAQSAWQFDQRRKDQMIDRNYVGEVAGTVEQLGAAEISNIVEGDTDFVVQQTDGSFVNMSVEEIRKVLDTEQVVLKKKLEKSTNKND